MSLIENTFAKGTLNLGKINAFNALYEKLSSKFPEHFDEKIRKVTRIDQFIGSIYHSVELAPSCIRYLDLLYHRNIPDEALAAFTYQVDIVDNITGGPVNNNGGNLRTHIFPRINNFELFERGVLNNDRVNGKVSQLEVYHVGILRSPGSTQSSDK